MKFIVMSMCRSGHRYITAWIIKNLLGKVTLYRNCTEGWEEGKMIPYKTDNRHIIDTINPGEGMHEVRTLEDVPLSKFDELEKVDVFNESKLVIVVRDPVNWLASSIRGGGYLNKNLEKAQEDIKKTHHRLYPMSRIEAYKTYLDDFEEFFSPSTIYVPVVEMINYTKFTTRKKYRDNVRKILGLENIVDDIPCHKKLKHGSIFGFSSFNDKGKNSNNRYNNMTVQQKHRIDGLMDKEMKSIKEKYFRN